MVAPQNGWNGDRLRSNVMMRLMALGGHQSGLPMVHLQELQWFPNPLSILVCGPQLLLPKALQSDRRP